MKLGSRIAAVTVLMFACGVFVGCSGSTGTVETGSSDIADIVTDTSFMADIVSNIAGDRLSVSALIPEGADPHSFEPTPQDARCLAQSRAVVINVFGLVPTIDDLIGGVVENEEAVIEAAAGLPGAETDPHCWLDPTLVVTYTENIVEGLTRLDPAGAQVYTNNSASYEEALRDLDSWIMGQVATIPVEDRLLVTNHESLGRFATRYGFTVVGAIFPTTSGEGSPSARSVAELVSAIQETGAPAIFLEMGANSEMAEQVGEASGAQVVTDLYIGSLGPGASTYIDMMRWNVTKIVEALR